MTARSLRRGAIRSIRRAEDPLLRSFFATRRQRNKRSAPPRGAADPLPSARRPPVTSGTAGPPPAAGFGESALVDLHGVGTVRRLAAAECLALEGRAGVCVVVLDGALELRAIADKAALSLGVVAKGECWFLDPGCHSYDVVALGPTTVVAVTRAGLALLPPATRRLVDDTAASTVAARFDALATCYASAGRRHTALASSVKERFARSSRLLASPAFGQMLATIPALPVHATDLAARLLDDGAHADEVVESIKNNPAVAALVLKRVNSAYYGLTTKVSDYYRALLLLGSNAVYQLVLDSAVATIVPDEPDAREIRARALVVSMLAYEIALVSKACNPLVASTIGLLHNIGDSLTPFLRRNRPEADSLLGCVDAPALGAAVLATWGLPERVHQVVAQQDHPRLLGPQELDGFVAEIGVLYLARACHDVALGGAAPPPYAGEYMTQLGLKETDCAKFCRDTLGPAIARKGDGVPAVLRVWLQAHATTREHPPSNRFTIDSP